jgi:hypothetical protein
VCVCGGVLPSHHAACALLGESHGGTSAPWTQQIQHIVDQVSAAPPRCVCVCVGGGGKHNTEMVMGQWADTSRAHTLRRRGGGGSAPANQGLLLHVHVSNFTCHPVTLYACCRLCAVQLCLWATQLVHWQHYKQQ